ncbi:cytidylate kinase family protein [Clostridium beijerinckii]|uniref:Cytidylate kinase n=1 Tax=Clostridium beijerinckii TaxID=1520 RepID=A0A1S9N482_CLOBE|nr:cytidylate kinase family protein [Clostridium beijerinckii]MZK51437.1 cytidylate kinase family protein [Clostridium beijerinckii]MZK59637.1 cytidylate kinase family protein [Clostridium beijerinckii]MZK69757.1 cytidylate kinase family protein [Clostridium beijerinckii]MZK84847.1 cytidylate kinase family protein [Clostridium beijerinckii]MZL08745.1 cytidylate kinase family protein [Clostridium beijerinckii]
MSRKELVKRYVIFLFGLFFNSFGVAFVTKASLGTSPIAAIPYTLSLIIPKLSLGSWTIIFSLVLIFIQLILLRKDANKVELLLQIIVSFIFGYFIDISMLCLKAFATEVYAVKIISLLFGCVILAFGAYLEIIADVVMLPGDAFVRTIAKVIKKEYGGVRVCSDISMTVVAGVLCLICFGKLLGVREGTVIAALIVGNIIRCLSKLLKRFTYILLPENKVKQETNVTVSEDNFVVTISREFGSGGREIGKKIAKKLGIAYYDSELIQMTANESGYAVEYVAENEQKLTNSLLHDLYSQYTAAITEEDMPRFEHLFHTEAKVIREIAAKESCVIVGRLASYILCDHENAMNVFISSDMDKKIKHVMDRDGISKTEAEKKIYKVEKERRNHCHYFTHKEWNDVKNYDIVIKSSKYGIEKTADTLSEIIKRNIQGIKENVV